ncbi:MAG: hypothetical protein DSY74_06255 [Actinobacteria bacterium]|nr:MAG: hypothetical protein DSY74_06255 [Actinomycetota bacterium]
MALTSHLTLGSGAAIALAVGIAAPAVALPAGGAALAPSGSTHHAIDDLDGDLPPTPSATSPTPPPATPTAPPTPRPTPMPSATPTSSVPIDPPDGEQPPAAPVPDIEVSAGWVGMAGCPPETPFLYRIQWSTTDADTVRLSGTWGSDEVALSGQAQRCGEMTAEFTVTATGAGGQAMVTVEAEATPAS